MDRKALAATMAELEQCRVKPAAAAAQVVREAPKDVKPPDPETALALKMAREVLEAPHIGVTDSLPENGLDSISGAKLANEFAKIGIAIALTDIYGVETVQDLRHFVQQGLENPIELETIDFGIDFEPVADEGTMGYCCFTLCQLLWNLFSFAKNVVIAAIYFSFWIHLCYTSDALQCDPNKYYASLYLAAAGLCIFFALVFEAVLVKWMVMGEYKPGVYPLFGRTHLAHWIVHGKTSWFLLFFNNTLLENWMLRWLGAEIGAHVSMKGTVLAAYDLLSVGDRCQIGQGSHLAGVEYVAGVMRVGPVTVGANSILGTQCVMGPSSSL